MSDEVSKEQADLLLATLDKVAIRLHAVTTDVSNTLEPVSLGLEQRGLMANVKLYVMIKYLLAISKELSRLANVVEPTVAERIVKHMTAEDMDVVHNGGYAFSPDTTTYVSVKADNKDTVMNWLKAHAEGKELIKEDVHAKTFESFIKKLKDDGKPIPPEVSVFERATLSMRKLKGK